MSASTIRMPTFYLREKFDKLANYIRIVERADGETTPDVLDEIAHNAQAIIEETERWRYDV